MTRQRSSRIAGTPTSVPRRRRAGTTATRRSSRRWCDLARLVNEVEGAGRGDKYIRLSKFLLDCRGNGESYDQSHLPVVQQYEAVGHAVRAAYCYSAMTDIAMETGDAEYHSAVKSLWNNLVNAKYYITGGIGSGETSEGFGRNFSLPNNAYCEVVLPTAANCFSSTR